ncbi:MAG: glycosyltransferase [Acidimicrobiia bacterium]
MSVPPSSVVDNHWEQLEGVAALGQFEPTISVSVVIPYYNRNTELALTLAALAEQTYPSELLEVVVADDGSDDPPRVSADITDRISVTVVHQEHDGFGAPRARNLGVQHARGDLIVFLDSDMIPVREHIEAHARWHSVAGDAVTVGSRRHADFDHLSAEQVGTAARDGDIARLVADQAIREPTWISDYVEATESLIERPGGHWRIMSGGNLGVSKRLYEEVGGSDESFNQWGGEDNELGFRLVQAGALVIPEPMAACWHQGEGHVPDADELKSLEMQRARLRQMIADVSFRGSKAGRSYAVPFIVVSIPAEGFDREAVGRCIDAVLACGIHDLAIEVSVPPGTEEAVWLHREYLGDPRVMFTEPGSHVSSFDWTPLRIELPPSALPLPGSIAGIVERFSDDSIDVLRLTVPGAPEGAALVTAMTGRAIHRIQRHRRETSNGGSSMPVWIRERWDVGGLFDIASNESPRPTVVRVTQSPPDPDAIDELVAEMYDLKRTIAVQKSRRSIQLSNALGGMLRVRGIGDLRRRIRQLLSALTDPRRYKPESRTSIASRFLKAFGRS